MRQSRSHVARDLERRLERPARRRADALDEALLLQVTFEVLPGDAREGRPRHGIRRGPGHEAGDVRVRREARQNRGFAEQVARLEGRGVVPQGLDEAVLAVEGVPRPVRKSKFYGAFVLNHRVVLHAIDATPARRRGRAVP